MTGKPAEPHEAYTGSGGVDPSSAETEKALDEWRAEQARESTASLSANRQALTPRALPLVLKF